MRFIAFFLFASANIVVAEEKVMQVEAPVGLEELATGVHAHSAVVRKGSHGLREYCYEAESYVVYATNLLGHGYKLSQDAPSKMECIKPKFAIVAKNKLGMFVGMKKAQVETLIGVHDLSDSQTIIWRSKVEHRNTIFDHQAYVKLKFEKGTLIWLSVFTTETS